MSCLIQEDCYMYKSSLHCTLSNIFHIGNPRRQFDKLEEKSISISFCSFDERSTSMSGSCHHVRDRIWRSSINKWNEGRIMILAKERCILVGTEDIPDRISEQLRFPFRFATNSVYVQCGRQVSYHIHGRCTWVINSKRISILRVVVVVNTYVGRIEIDLKVWRHNVFKMIEIAR